MKIVCVEPLGISKERFEQLKAKYAQKGHQFEYYLDRKEDESTLAERMKEAEVAVISNIKLPAAVLQQCHKLQYLSVAFTGLDHIDLAYCEEHNIKVQNAAGYSTVAVSELAIGLMLDVLRRITWLDADTHKGGTRNNFLGRELHGKTVGCKVLAYNRSEHDDVKAMGVKYTDLDTLMKKSDMVTLHVPMTNDTHYLINKDRIGMMKPTAILINTARGNVVDMEALATALNEGKIAGAGIDVYEKEPPLPLQHPLLNAPNCICLPHVGYASREAFDIRADIVFDHVDQYLGQ